MNHPIYVTIKKANIKGKDGLISTIINKVKETTKPSLLKKIFSKKGLLTAAKVGLAVAFPGATAGYLAAKGALKLGKKLFGKKKANEESPTNSGMEVAEIPQAEKAEIEPAEIVTNENTTLSPEEVDSHSIETVNLNEHTNNITDIESSTIETVNTTANEKEEKTTSNPESQLKGELPLAFYQALKAYFDNKQLKLIDKEHSALEIKEGDRSNNLD